MKFPIDFWFGTALSSHQSEGGNHNSWTEWENKAGTIKNGERSGNACDHWNRFEEDFEKLVWLGANTHRLSIEWSRLVPEQGCWNFEAEAHYRKMFLSLQDKNIRVMVTLFHFTLPVWAADIGGFENPQVCKDFENFALRSQKVFGDVVRDWLTFNEPMVYALGSYGAGVMPPGIKNLKRALQVAVNLIRLHARVYRSMKAIDSAAQISFVQHLRIFDAKNKFSPLDHYAVRLADAVFNWIWYEAILYGKIKFHVPMVAKINEMVEECLGAMDYLAFNYYGRDLISLRPFSAEKFQLSTEDTPNKTDMGWEIYPEGLVKLLRKIKKLNLEKYPVIITENGMADNQRPDVRRISFLHDHLHAFLITCQQEQLIPKGYLYWSLLDNFEWAEGFYPRFGLFEVDYKTQNRTARDSATYFRCLSQSWSLLPR